MEIVFDVHFLKSYVFFVAHYGQWLPKCRPIHFNFVRPYNQSVHFTMAADTTSQVNKVSHLKKRYNRAISKRQNILPQYIVQQLIVNSNIHTYNTRQQSDIHYNPIRTKLEEQLINTKISVEWNSLDEAIKDSLSSPSAIANLKNFLLQKYN